jgi:hypothetical protein
MTEVLAPTCYYAFEIPDPSRPISGNQRGAVGPSGELVAFTPAPADPALLAGRKIVNLLGHAGTYGMGGPGFVAIELAGSSAQEWLVVALWGAGSWMTCQGRLVEDWHHQSAGRPAPWFSDTEGAAPLARELAGRAIEAMEIRPRSLRIAISGGYDLTIAEDAASRPAFAGNGKPRVFQPEDDLMRAVFLSPTVELWV